MTKPANPPRSAAPEGRVLEALDVAEVDATNLQELLEATPDLVALSDGSHFLYLNRAASDFLGLGDSGDLASVLTRGDRPDGRARRRQTRGARARDARALGWRGPARAQRRGTRALLRRHLRDGSAPFQAARLRRDPA